MSKKSHIYDEPEGKDASLEGGDLIVPPEGGDSLVTPPEAKAQPKHEGTVNDLMSGWWKQVKDHTPDPATFGDSFTAYAAARGWALVDADTLPPPDPPPAE